MLRDDYIQTAAKLTNEVIRQFGICNEQIIEYSQCPICGKFIPYQRGRSICESCMNKKKEE